MQIEVVLDLSELFALKRFSEQNKPYLLETAAQRFVRYLRARFIGLSGRTQGSGQWRELAESTVRKKEARGAAANPQWILRETDDLYNAITGKVENGRYIVGFIASFPHTRLVKSDPHRTTLQIAVFHHFGRGRNPVRSVVAMPNEATKRKMADDIRERYNQVIRRNRRP